VSGFVGLLDKQLKVNKPAIQEYIFHINQGISRMNALIDSILTASTLDHDDEEDQLVNTERILLEVKDRLGALCQEKNGAIIYEEDLPSIYGKYHQLSLLFQNIIENGLKYNEQEPAVVEISGKMETRGYTFSIRDNGIGIAPQDREKVFNMFKRLHSREDYSGTGIGLSMCKKIVEHLDGKIWITAPADGGPGTVFHIYIPREKIAIPGQVLSSSKTD
jgi:signal transduction histidine kinase